jgi:hypothetical protein
VVVSGCKREGDLGKVATGCRQMDGMYEKMKKIMMTHVRSSGEARKNL